ncbi:Crp/Fnr family transcriptional regulator [Thaumasiovibrio subtropicus]|uniref:Crp/Fnr family transcriptional regulator n=1 Tax=Thaumasiovibrio subtropicus TaxID=1891207 RepID=UPI000B35E301|nr:Crp/Fnr family transcriptional regulator [Thaumasiovibrio subtropicus]
MSYSIFETMTKAERDQLLAQSCDIECQAGETLFEQGDDATNMYKVVKGKISLYRLMPNGDEKLFKVFMAGGIIAEVAMFMSPRAYPMSARIDQDSQLIAIPYYAINELVYHSPTLSERALQYMSNHILQLMNTQNILTQVSAHQRLVMRFAEIYRQQHRHEDTITLPVTKKLLATQLGMTPETLSRAITKLKKAALIEEHGAQIVISDIPKLCEFVNLTDDIFLPTDSSLKL